MQIAEKKVKRKWLQTTFLAKWEKVKSAKSFDLELDTLFPLIFTSDYVSFSRKALHCSQKTSLKADSEASDILKK